MAHLCTKCANDAVTNLLFGLCRSVWVIDLLVLFLVPILELQHALLPQSVVTHEAYPNSSFFRYVHLGFTFESIKELGSASLAVVACQYLGWTLDMFVMSLALENGWGIIGGTKVSFDLTTAWVHSKSKKPINARLECVEKIKIYHIWNIVYIFWLGLIVRW